ncbi:MAG TPA: gas vesicle protein [Candidatus Angelobacter sp.]|nr:gas vesicle protein [Candidatus Angelobacter sp.]
MPNDFETVEIGSASQEDVSILDILDHVLNAGVVVQGSLVISVAGVDLVYLGLNVVLTSVETALRSLNAEPKRPKR